MSRPSKFLSLILRHQPELVGITLDANGWTPIDALLVGLAQHGVHLSRDQLLALVADSDKQRFAISDDGLRIRANQGHSVAVELDLPDATPPARLYHGTYPDALASIHAQGLIKGARHAVHMAADTTTAATVGMRRGAPVILVIRADEMVAAGHRFQVSANGVWLTEHVPARYLEFPSERARGEWRHWAGGDTDRVAMADATLRAITEGSYTTADGAHVSIAATLDTARNNTTLHALGDPLRPPRSRTTTRFTVVDESTTAAILRLTAQSRAHVCALNFASAKHPGGGWRTGARAQEEALARTSALVPCLEAQPDYYARNTAARSPLYLDLVLFSPYVPFFRDDHGTWLARPQLASVITAAAPNASALRQRGNVDEDAITQTVQRRAQLALAVCAHHGVERLILGAWGAGVFGNDPNVVADAFARVLRGELAGAFAEVVFAVLGGPGAANYDAFARAFGDT